MEDVPPTNRTPSVSDRRSPAFILTKKELMLLSITATGNFLDSYDLLIINPVSTMLQYRLYNGHDLPPKLEGFLKSGALIGNVIGQLTFGYLADALGRKAICMSVRITRLVIIDHNIWLDGKELIVIIIGTILCLSTPTGLLSPDHSLIYLSVFRIIVGIGVGGDYPMSSSITSDRAGPYKRGTMLAYVSSMQGWGSVAGSLMAIIVLLCYKHVIHDEGQVSKVDGVWRIIVGVSLVPAFGTLYQRLTLPESPSYMDTHRADHPSAQGPITSSSTEALSSHLDGHITEQEHRGGRKMAHLREFLHFLSEWRHAKLLIGTCLCWFLMNMSFYGVNLNQNFVLEQIGFGGHRGTAWQKLIRISTGNLIITCLGLLPGYYFTVLFIEVLGRKWIQIQGCCLTAIFLGILAAKFHTLHEASFVVCFALMQFFFNFGANMTVYIIPSELFPTRYRAFAHGISAASGKCGAILSSLVFNQLAQRVGVPIILWIFFCCVLLTAVITLLLLPEVKGRDADAVFEAERQEGNRY